MSKREQLVMLFVKEIAMGEQDSGLSVGIEEQTELEGGVVWRADVTLPRVMQAVRARCQGGYVQCIGADPPYGNIVDEGWDEVESIVGHKDSDEAYEKAFVEWMIAWTLGWSEVLEPGGAFNIWGGVGVPGFRPFYAFMNQIERASGGKLALANHITWKKKRAYGVQHNYLFTREELAYLVKGDPKKPRVFNIPLLEEKRGYAGYNAKYPAKSEYLRRSNVWDISELFKGKRHRCHKPPRVNEIPIEVSTRPGEIVLDLFSGSGSLSRAAQGLDRKWIAIEREKETYDKIVTWLGEPYTKVEQASDESEGEEQSLSETSVEAVDVHPVVSKALVQPATRVLPLKLKSFWGK